MIFGVPGLHQVEHFEFSRRALGHFEIPQKAEVPENVPKSLLNDDTNFMLPNGVYMMSLFQFF